jgi:rSAM/selenodomain-associated transferase 1
LRRHFIVYAKRPLPGYAKTRLGMAIGEQQAAGVYARLLYTYLLDLVQADLDASIELSVTSPEDVPFFAGAFPELLVRPQVGGDLGERMRASFQQAFLEGAEYVVLTGSDIPRLDSALVRTAFDVLEAAPVAIGPAADGGYYLIGMRAPGANLFKGVAWSSNRVLAQTKALAEAQGLRVARIAEQHDLDVYDEFVRWQQSLTATRPDPTTK